MAKTAAIPTDATKAFGTFTNAAGEVYTIHGLSPLLPNKIMDAVRNDFVKQGKGLPVIPTYTVPATEAHEEEIHEHTEKSILEGTPEQVKENQAAWDKYQLLSAELNREYNARIMRATLLTVQTTPTQAWRDDMKFIGTELPPEGSPEERYLFIETHVIQCPADLSGLTLMAFRTGGIIQEEATAEVEATFRGFVERAFIEAGRQESIRG